MSLQKSIKDAKAELKERFDDGETNLQNLLDASHEIADSFVPVYERDLIEACREDLSLFTNEPENECSRTPTSIVSANYYEKLVQSLSAYAEELAGSFV